MATDPVRNHRFALLVAVLVLMGCGSDDGVGPVEDPGPGSCAEITTFETGATPSAVIHVAAGGTGDGSEADPLGSLRDAIDHPQFGPGAAVRIHAGTYNGGTYLADVRGTASEPIWIGGAPGQARPVFQGGSQAVHLVRPAYVILHDIEVRGATVNGINVDDGGAVEDAAAAHHVVFRGLQVHDIGTGGNNDGLKLSGLRDYWVLDSEFANVNAGSGIDHVGCHRGLIARCRFTDMGSNAIQCKGGSQQIEIRWNHFENAGQRGVNIGGSTGDPYFRPPLSQTEPNVEAREIHVIANVFVGGVTPFAFVGAVDCSAAQNTIVDPTNWLLRILQETTSHDGFEFLPTRDCRLVNNLFYFDRSELASTDINVGPNTEASSFVVRNNLWYAHDAPANSEPDLPVAETGGVVGQDPDLRQPDRGDYRLGATSAAASAGLAPPPTPGDFTGRCFADPPAIGAHAADVGG